MPADREISPVRVPKADNERGRGEAEQSRFVPYLLCAAPLVLAELFWKGVPSEKEGGRPPIEGVVARVGHVEPSKDTLKSFLLIGARILSFDNCHSPRLLFRIKIFPPAHAASCCDMRRHGPLQLHTFALFSGGSKIIGGLRAPAGGDGEIRRG
jgi:hypothetical protein